MYHYLVRWSELAKSDMGKPMKTYVSDFASSLQRTVYYDNLSIRNSISFVHCPVRDQFSNKNHFQEDRGDDVQSNYI